MAASEATPLLNNVPEDQQPTSSLLDGMTSMLLSSLPPVSGNNSTNDSNNKLLSYRHRKNSSSLSKCDPITAALRRGGSGVVDNLPPGGIPDEFEPRPVYDRRHSNNNNHHASRPGNGGAKRKKSRRGMKEPSVGGGWLEYVVGIGPAFASRSSNTANSTLFTNIDEDSYHHKNVGTLLIPRKAPIKVEPKVYFANERTLLAWLYLVIFLAGASAMIVTYASKDEDGVSTAKLGSQLYGIVLLPVSLAFAIYALWQYQKRSIMIKHHSPGPYIDIVGPTTITLILVMTITAQFCLKLQALMYG